MIQAGQATDQQIDELAPLLEPGDVIMDGGNARFQDTIRRERALRAQGLEFLGTGISGGEEGARHGPSIMAGGAPEAFAPVAEILRRRSPPRSTARRAARMSAPTAPATSSR